MKSINGFSLIEVLLVVALVSVLTAISLISFRAYTESSIDTATLADLRSSLSAVELLSEKLPDPGDSSGGVLQIRSVIPDFALTKTSSDFCFVVRDHKVVNLTVCTNQGSVGGYAYNSGLILPLSPGGCNCA